MLKFGKERVHREESFNSVCFMSVVLARQSLGKDHMRRPCNKKNTPAKQHGIWRKKMYKLSNSDKTTFYTPDEVKAMPAPASTRPEEREFVVDSGASVHMTSKKKRMKLRRDGHSERVQNPTAVLTASGEVHTHEEAQVFVHDQNLFVTVHLLEETPAVLSLGRLCEDHRYSF